MHWNLSQFGRFFPPLTARKKHCFFGKLRERGAGFLPQGASPPSRSIGVSEKKLPEILKNSEFVWQDAATVQRAASSAMRQTRNSLKSSCANLLQPSHQYGLQIVEGMVTFFESYERELERYG